MNLKDIPKLVINLQSRPDRLALIKKELKDLPAFIMPGFVDEVPMIGIAKAHLNCIRYAKYKGWPQVLIMEDDLMLRPGYLEYLQQAFKEVPSDWNVLIGGVYEVNKVEPINTYWDRIGEFCGLHFYIVNYNAYDTILKYDMVHHIDRWMNLNGKRLNTYLTKKYVAIQRDGYSDNVKSKTFYNEIKLNKHKLL